MNNENEIERMAELICSKPHSCDVCDFCGRPCGYQETVIKLIKAGIGDKKQAAKSAVRDFITRLSYVRKSTVDDDGEPIVTVGVVNFDDMVDMYHELYGAEE